MTTVNPDISGSRLLVTFEVTQPANPTPSESSSQISSVAQAVLSKAPPAPPEYSSNTGLPLPDPLAFKPKENTSKPSTPKPSTPTVNGGSKPSTPKPSTPKPVTPKTASALLTPTAVADPNPPQWAYPTHSANQLLGGKNAKSGSSGVPQKEVGKLRKKQKHSLYASTPTADRDLLTKIPRVTEYLSKARKHLERRKGVPTKLPPVVFGDRTVTVLDGNSIRVEIPNQGKIEKRTWGIHSQKRSDGSTSERYYPVDGDGVIVFEKGRSLTPADLVTLTNQYRSTPSPSVSPEEFLRSKTQTPT